MRPLSSTDSGRAFRVDLMELQIYLVPVDKLALVFGGPVVV